ncbi:phosphodiester glycosidase family protein [Granulicella arctica]|uniref:phosphodiester glycosidase family protein n=1 Tax=Granulicella arctica TaxID=940613 RepID=UPI001C535A06
MTSKQLTTGVSYYQIKRGEIDPSAFWTVNMGFFPTYAAAKLESDNLLRFAVAPRIDPSAGKKLGGSVLGYWLSVGKYISRVDASDAAAHVAAVSGGMYKPIVRNTALGGYPTRGPWVINVLAIRPSETTSELAIVPAGQDNLGADGETVSVAAARLGALAATNGSFFSNINPFHAPLPPRSPLGATVINGNLIATAAGGRPGVIIEKTNNGHQTVRILRKLTTYVTVSDQNNDGAEIEAIDRPILGTVVNCGVPAGSPDIRPEHDSVCKNDNDLVMYDGLYHRGASSNAQVDPHYRGSSYELLVDRSGTVTKGQDSLGLAPPPGGYVLQGLGKSAVWLRAHSAQGTKLRVARRLFADGVEVGLHSGMSVLEGGPLLSDSNLTGAADQEGFGPRSNGFDGGDANGSVPNNWYNGWFVSRNARTALGITEGGTVLIVEIDGRQPTLSLGASIPETAAVMRWLGATSAINLDGGGSSNMVVNGISVGHPSDVQGERGVGDLLMILPK